MDSYGHNISVHNKQWRNKFGFITYKLLTYTRRTGKTMYINVHVRAWINLAFRHLAVVAYSVLKPKAILVKITSRHRLRTHCGIVVGLIVLVLIKNYIFNWICQTDTKLCCARMLDGGKQWYWTDTIPDHQKLVSLLTTCWLSSSWHADKLKRVIIILSCL